MGKQSLSLSHLVRPASKAVGKPPLLVLLHGVGSNERDLFSMAPYLDPRLLIVSARAPHLYGPVGFAWFQIEWTPTGFLSDTQQAEASRDLLVEFIGEAVEAYECDPTQVYLMGFSQGAIMSSLVALTRPDLIAGTVLMSGRIPPEVLPVIAPHDQLAGKPFLVVHGVLDDVLPIQYGRASRELLEALPVELSYKEYPMGHSVSPESLADVVAWLKQRLDRSLGVRS